MSKKCCTAFSVVALFICSVSSLAAMPIDEAIIVTVDRMVWGDAPPALPAGARLVVLSGDPSTPGANYTMRASVPAGYVVPPHWHPTAENVTVLSGSIEIGMGDAIDRSTTQKLGVGAYFSMPAEHRHYALFDEATTIQLHGVGPFGINYVNPEDDPTQAMPGR